MTDTIDREIAAIRSVLAALEPLDAGVRANVLDYVLKRLGITSTTNARTFSQTPSVESTGQKVAEGGQVHIEAFKDQKNPRSANEMAALVAYYLANLAPSAERKQSITSKDIETQFKIAGFPLPKAVRLTLTNAKAAGYLDSAGEGEYRLNAVGHNLVAHNMPRGSGTSTKRGGRRKAKKAKVGKAKARARGRK